jgi:hypothetical protein
VKIFLSAGLKSHRRGRFLSSLLGAVELIESDVPASGMLLMCGDEYQAVDDESRDRLDAPGYASRNARWCFCRPMFKVRYPVRRIGQWRFPKYSRPADDPESLAFLLAAEITFRISGPAGQSDVLAGHSWSDGSSHTRYRKAFSNSGLIAATTLPLWSISLVNHAEKVRTWLEAIDKLTGRSAAANRPSNEDEQQLRPEDYTVLVCCHGFGVSNPSALSDAVKQSAVPVFNLSSFDVPGSFSRLLGYGFLDDAGLTPAGLSHLMASRYWPYAENMKGAD